MNKNKLIALIHRVAAQSEIPFNVVLTHYFMERILQRISASAYKSAFIYKGGFLLSNIYGISVRATVDMDFLVLQENIHEQSISQVFGELFRGSEDAIDFEITKLEPIHEEDEHTGYRISVLCQFENIQIAIPIDIATGDALTSAPISYEYKSIFNKETYIIQAYNLETIMAEKLQTIFERGLFNSRSKDFYDVYYISTMNKQMYKPINNDLLRKACEKTFAYRNSIFSIEAILQTISEIRSDPLMNDRWIRFANKFSYAHGLAFPTVLDTIEALVLNLSMP